MVGRLSSLAALAAVANAAAPVVDVKTSPIVNVNLGTTYQEFDGMGISEAFQRGRIIKGADGLTGKNTELVLDLLFSNTTGAGLTILRNGIGSSPSEPYDHMESIAPVAPKNNASALNYVSLNSLRGDQQQLWLSKQFLARGGKKIYADAWSADGYMKSTGTDINGGLICGVTGSFGDGSNCTADWRQAYADKLIHFLQDYKSQGIDIDYVGFLNEPEYTSPYASMNSDGQQAVDFLDVLYPTLMKSGLATKIACCDGEGWEGNRARIENITALGAADMLGLVTSHGYAQAPSTPFNTTHHTWITEWSTFDAFNPAWYVYGGQSEGLTWANHIQSAFYMSNVSGFVYWWGAANDSDNEPLIHIPGNQVVPSKRLWSMAHWGRLVQPGAVRTAATVQNFGGSVLNATSFYNPDGSVAIQVINNGANATSVSLKGAMNTKTATVTSWLTDNNNNFTSNTLTQITGGMIVTTLPAYSLTSFFITEVKGAKQVADVARLTAA